MHKRNSAKVGVVKCELIRTYEISAFSYFYTQPRLMSKNIFLLQLLSLLLRRFYNQHRVNLFEATD